MHYPDNTTGSIFKQLDLNLSGWQVIVAVVAALAVVLGVGGCIALMLILGGGGR